MTAGSRRFVASLLIVGMLGSALVAGLAGLFASQEPDALERVAQEQGFASTEQPSAASDGLLAGYGVDGIENEGLSTSISTAAGLGLTLVLGLGLFWFLSRRPKAGTGPGGSVAGLGEDFASPVGEDLSPEPQPGDDPWPDRG